MISSQVLFEVRASDINVHMSSFDFACANLVLLLPVKSEVFSISVNQSSNWEESFPFNTVISCNNELLRDIFFSESHKVFVYLFRSSPMGSVGVGE